MSFRDEWPKMPDGRDFDGRQLLSLVSGGNSPFHEAWDVNQLLQEVEDNVGARVIDIPRVYNGSNNYVSSLAAPYVHVLPCRLVYLPVH